MQPKQSDKNKIAEPFKQPCNVYHYMLLTFDVMFEDRSVVILAPGNLESCAGVGLTTLVTSNNLNLSAISVLTLGDIQVPHAIIDQLMTASLNMYIK